MAQAVTALAGPQAYPVRWQVADRPFHIDTLKITPFPLTHRVPCCGYLLALPRAGRFDPARARAAGIPMPYWKTLQRGEAVGGCTPEQVLGAPRRGLKAVSYTHLQFADGTATVYITDLFEHRYTDYATAADLLVFFVCFVAIMVALIQRKVRVIKTLESELRDVYKRQVYSIPRDFLQENNADCLKNCENCGKIKINNKE